MSQAVLLRALLQRCPSQETQEIQAFLHLVEVCEQDLLLLVNLASVSDAHAKYLANEARTGLDAVYKVIGFHLETVSQYDHGHWLPDQGENFLGSPTFHAQALTIRNYHTKIEDELSRVRQVTSRRQGFDRESVGHVDLDPNKPTGLQKVGHPSSTFDNIDLLADILDSTSLLRHQPIPGHERSDLVHSWDWPGPNKHPNSGSHPGIGHQATVTREWMSPEHVHVDSTISSWSKTPPPPQYVAPVPTELEGDFVFQGSSTQNTYQTHLVNSPIYVDSSTGFGIPPDDSILKGRKQLEVYELQDTKDRKQSEVYELQGTMNYNQSDVHRRQDLNLNQSKEDGQFFSGDRPLYWRAPPVVEEKQVFYGYESGSRELQLTRTPIHEEKQVALTDTKETQTGNQARDVGGLSLLFR